MANLLLVLDMEGNSPFDAEAARRCLRRLPGIRNWDEDDSGYQFFFEFDFAGDSATVHMSRNDLQCISIESSGDAGLQVALEIQRRYGEEIYAFDDSCSFCIPLSRVSSLADFTEKIVSEFGHEKLEKKG